VSHHLVPDWLGHLRTDRRGLPVPYVNLWGVEDVTRIRMGFDRHIAGPALFLDDEAETVPDFTKQHMARQRECMIAGLCQVCARPVPWSRRFLIVTGFTVQAIAVPELGEVVSIHEPWLCERCARFASQKCPALIRRTHEDDLQLIPVTSKRDVRMVASIGYVDGPLSEETQRVKPVMWVKVLLAKYSLEART